MDAQEKTRVSIVNAFRAGMSAVEILTVFKYKKDIVYRLKKKYDDFIAAGGSPDQFVTARKVHKKHKDNKAIALKDTVKEMVDSNPSRSMRNIATELNVAPSTIVRIMKEQLGYKSYALRRGQFMTEATKARRAEKAKKLINRLKSPASQNMLIFFSDEKNFTQDQKVNRKNNRWLCSNPKEVPIVMATKFPATVMVLGVVSNEGDVMPPHFFPKGLKINTDEYIKVLEEVVKPWMDSVAGGRHYVFQQDGAPAHTSLRTQEWCRKNLPEVWEKEIWPPSSPDCNPLDYFVWSVCEVHVNKAPNKNSGSLMAKMKEVMGSLDWDMVAKACRRFRSRLEAVVEAGVDFIK